MYVKRLFKICIITFLAFICISLHGSFVYADESDLKQVALASEYAWYNNSGEWVNIENNPVTVPSGTYELRVQVKLSEALKKSNTYDLKLEFEHQTNNNISLNRYAAMNSGSNLISDFSASSKFVTSSNKSILYLYDCTYKQDDLVVLRVYFDDIVSPVPNSEYGVLYVTNIKLYAENVTTESTIKGILDALLKIPTNIANSLRSMFESIVTTLNSVKSFIVDGITNALNSVKNALSTLLQSIIDGLVTLGNFIIDGLKALFIPSDNYFTDKINSVYDLLELKLGFLFFPIELLKDIVTLFSNLDSGTGLITIPEVVLFDVNVIPATSFDLGKVFSDILGDKYQLYYSFVDVIFICLFLNYLINAFKSVLFDTVVGSTDSAAADNESVMERRNNRGGA